MQDYVVNRPEEGAMNRVLAAAADSAAGVILRLAWQAGLLRDEIQHLTWAQVDFGERKLLLPDREVPISPELSGWLEALRDSRNRCSAVVVLSDRDKKPLTPQSISRLARAALDSEGQTAVRLIDLRHDYILRQLEEHDWQYVSRITGVESTAIKVHFAGHLKEKKVSTRARREAPAAHIDEFALWKLLQAEDTSPAGVALWLTWQMGLRLEEIVALRWDQVDLPGERLLLPERTVELAVGVGDVLARLRREEPPAERVLVSRRSGRPYDRTRLSKMVRTALVRGGMDDVTLRDLRLDWELRGGGESRVLSYLRKHPSITRNEAAELLGVSRSTAYNRLKQLVKREKVTQVGARYYLRDTVVPPERQAEVILDYLRREGFAYRQDIARLLNIDPGQCRPILQRMIADGQIVQDHQKYILK